MTPLIQTELIKIFKNSATKICFIVLIFIMLGVSITEYQDIFAFRNNTDYQNEIMSWSEREENLIKYASESLQEPWYNKLQKEQIKKRIDVAKYRLDNDIPKDIYKNVWWFFNDKSFNLVSTITILMMIIIGSINIAGEYSSNTLRQVLLLPYKRWKILLSKFCAIVLTGLILYGFVFVIGVLSGILLHGTEGISSQVVLYFGNDITTINMSFYSILIVLFKLVEIIFYSVMILLISVMTKSTSASMLVTSTTAIFSVPVSNLLASYYSILNYSPFLNIDFRRYLDFGTTMPMSEVFFENNVVEGITPVVSIVIIVITILIFMGASFAIFSHQDV